MDLFMFLFWYFTFKYEKKSPRIELLKRIKWNNKEQHVYSHMQVPDSLFIYINLFILWFKNSS